MDTSKQKLYDEWMSMDATFHNITEKKKDQKGIRVAIKALEASLPILMQFKNAMIAEPGDIPFFLNIHTNGKDVTASLVIANEETEEKMKRLTCHGDDAKLLAACYANDFQDAEFLTSSFSLQDIKRIMIYPKEGKMIHSKVVPMSVGNLKHLLSKGNIENFAVGIQKA